ncbi:MAG: zinc-binding dehydrogenase [Deltaproteobacteria bacterium]|jgi:2-desacetyl-2-hydroxyethyl bacteriochlorophyllide A dehydrogenase|nr:zinc-binding dehydrogenase [Deltaproteobacteria bacterium]
MKRTTLIFEKPHTVAIKEAPIPAPGAREVLIKTIFSAISAGSELLIYRGQMPSGLPADTTIKALSKPFRYPLKYGYASVGQVVAAGSGVDQQWRGRQVFCFHPHESHYTATTDDIVILPEEIDPKEALFLANMETAVNFLMDGRPAIGERVCVFGQGIVGLLTTALLAQFPLHQLVIFDRYAARRRAALDAGADIALDPDDPASTDVLPYADAPNATAGPADLVYELSGNPQALNQAIQVAGFGGRIVLGSWYGRQKAQLDLGGRFHRNRIQLISSQVSTLSPELSGRWTKKRRIHMAWEMIRRCEPAQFISHQFPLTRAKEAYDLLDKNPDEALQVIFTYGS